MTVELDNAVKDLLKEARARIDRRDHWTKNVLARDAFNQPIHATDPEACKFCIVGALNAGDPDAEVKGRAQYLLTKALPYVGNEGLTSFNDGVYTTHKDILSLFDKAIGDLT